jgi:hypothetical protein
LIAALDRLDRSAHSFSKGTAVEDFGGLLATSSGVSVQIILAMQRGVAAHGVGTAPLRDVELRL